VVSVVKRIEEYVQQLLLTWSVLPEFNASNRNIQFENPTRFTPEVVFHCLNWPGALAWFFPVAAELVGKS
jgi:hypothetical protein